MPKFLVFGVHCEIILKITHNQSCRKSTTCPDRLFMVEISKNISQTTIQEQCQNINLTLSFFKSLFKSIIARKSDSSNLLQFISVLVFLNERIFPQFNMCQVLYHRLGKHAQTHYHYHQIDQRVNWFNYNYILLKTHQH